jgi:hypothetical protein
MDIKIDTVLGTESKVSAIGGAEATSNIFLFNYFIRWLQI